MIDGIDGAVGHHLADGEAAIRLEITHRLLGAPSSRKYRSTAFDIFAHHRGQIGIGHRASRCAVYSRICG